MPAGRGKAWDALAFEAKERAGWRCERCHGAGALEAHHRRPLQEGGELLVPVEELEVLCRDCHIEAHRARRPVIGHEAWEALVAELAAEGPPRGGRP